LGTNIHFFFEFGTNSVHIYQSMDLFSQSSLWCKYFEWKISRGISFLSIQYCFIRYIFFQLVYMSVIIVKWTKNHIEQSLKLQTLLYNLMWYYLNLMLIIGSCVKWLISMLKNSNIYNLVSIFDLSKTFLNLNNTYTR
jgi:hypothetical protein